MGVRNGKPAAVVKITVRWKLTCLPGLVGCEAKILAGGRGTFAFDKGREDVTCAGPCDRVTNDTGTLLGADNPNQFTFVFNMLSGCFGLTRTKVTLVFSQNTGKLDLKASDLNGNGKPDGEEKEK
jgi:hypothetical protein